ncbi:hypothetical protein GN244_ATG10015 [Phytophthora infestans]|uniref:Uncharacterized protein n=1 Tax=Phytophthora infestans TaxID=4787 RepID=A0A833STH9_PHYIN|nr:hypothetical protein GN244_ATG10015 [Phytophthora infestans]KAF4149523.1 hypothetical protein GN958_ATG01286 [Phytophthora infestans]
MIPHSAFCSPSAPTCRDGRARHGSRASGGLLSAALCPLASLRIHGPAHIAGLRLRLRHGLHLVYPHKHAAVRRTVVLARLSSRYRTRPPAGESPPNTPTCQGGPARHGRHATGRLLFSTLVSRKYL